MKVHLMVHFFCMRELLKFVRLLDVLISFVESLESLKNICIITSLKGAII